MSTNTATSPTAYSADDEASSTATASYKPQLDQAARDAKLQAEKPSSGESATHPIVQKVSHYVPAVGKLLGNKNEVKQPTQSPQKLPGPPERPTHDTQIEEFVRDQHRSKPTDAVDEALQ